MEERPLDESIPEHSDDQLPEAEPVATELTGDELADVAGGGNGVCGFGCPEH